VLRNGGPGHQVGADRSVVDECEVTEQVDRWEEGSS